MKFKTAKLLAIIDLNTFLYLMSRIPIIKHLGFYKLISKTKLKSNIAFLGTVFKLGMSFLLELIFPWLITVTLLNRVLGVDDVNAFYNMRIMIYIILFCLLDIIDKPSFLNDHKNAYIFMGMLGVNADVFYKNKIINSLLTSVLAHLFVARVIFKDWTIAFTILFLKIACNLLSNVIYLNYIKKYEKMMGKFVRRVLYFILLGIPILMVFTRYEIELTQNMLYLISLSSISIGVVLFVYLMRYKHYEKIKMVMANFEVFKASFTATTGMTEDYKELSNFTSEDNLKFLHEHQNLDTASYIEKAFKVRFKDFLKSQFKAKINGIIFMSAIYILLFKFGITAVKNFTGLATFGIVIVLTAGYAGNYLKMCFRNIDLPFFYHKLYSQAEIEKSLNMRLKHIASRVLPNIVLAVIAIAIIGIINRIEIQYALVPKVLAIYFGILTTREMWEVMMYYLLCPYSTDLSNKSIISKAFKVIMSLLIGFCYVGGFDIDTLFYIVSAVFVVTIIAFIFSRRFFAKTFKLRY